MLWLLGKYWGTGVYCYYVLPQHEILFILPLNIILMQNIIKFGSNCNWVRIFIKMSLNVDGTNLGYHCLRWLEIVSWRVRPGPLIARARASTPGSRRCKFSDLVPSKILQNLYFDQKYLWKLTVKICKIWHSGKDRIEIFVLIERKNSVRRKQNERENLIIENFSESFLQNFLKIGSLVGFIVQNNFSKFEKNSPYKFYEK